MKKKLFSALILVICLCLCTGLLMVYLYPPMPYISWDDEYHFDQALTWSYLGEERLASLLLTGSLLQPFVAGLLGLIPSCAASARSRWPSACALLSPRWGRSS